MKKIILPIILLLTILLTSCGGSETITDTTDTTNSTNTTNVTNTTNTTNTNQNNEVRAIPREDDTTKEIVQKEVENIPEWAKDEMNIEEPKGLKFIDGISRDRGSQKSIFILYSGDFTTLKKEGEKLARKAGLKLDKDPSAPKNSISYSNSIPDRQGETTDGSKYLKSITILEAPDDELDNIEDDYTMGISIMDSGLIKN